MVVRRRGVRGFDGAALRTARTSRQLSEEDLGRAVGMPASLICAYEEGRRVPEWRTLAALAAALSGTIDELRPGHAITMEDLRCGAGQSQAEAGSAAGLTRSGYAMLENGHTRTLAPGVAAKLASSWQVDAGRVALAHAAAVHAAGEPAPVLEGAVLEGLAGHFGISREVLLELARSMHHQAERRNS